MYVLAHLLNRYDIHVVNSFVGSIREASINNEHKCVMSMAGPVLREGVINNRTTVR